MPSNPLINYSSKVKFQSQHNIEVGNGHSNKSDLVEKSLEYLKQHEFIKDA